jgi:anti-sigma factor (TIGR02949 family)
MMEQQNVNVGLRREGSPYSEQECENIIQQLEALMDGDLDPAKEKEVRQMVEGCEYCMEQYNLEKSLRRLIRNGFNNIFVSHNLLSNIRRKLNIGSGATEDAR